MATVHTSPSELSVRFPPVEKVAGLVRDVQVPRSAITAAELVPDPLAALHGLRAPGLSLPGVRKIGTWRGKGSKVLVSIRHDQPAVRIRLTGQRYDSLLIGADDAAALVDSLTATIRGS